MISHPIGYFAHNTSSLIITTLHHLIERNNGIQHTWNMIFYLNTPILFHTQWLHPMLEVPTWNIEERKWKQYNIHVTWFFTSTHQYYFIQHDYIQCWKFRLGTQKKENGNNMLFLPFQQFGMARCPNLNSLAWLVSFPLPLEINIRPRRKLG